MAETATISDFVHQLETSLRTRRLYAPHMAPYQEAAQRLLEKCRTAVAPDGFTLRVTGTDLFHGKASIAHRPKREECFFFPLYRDGLRELTFQPEVSAEELDALLGVFEAEEKGRLAAGEDTVAFLWKCELQGVTYAAIDGIGDQEGDDDPEAGKDDYRALVAELAEKIQSPAAPETGQSYAFVLDADVRVAASDLHYERDTQRRTFEENPTVLRLTPEEAAALRERAGEGLEATLLDDFVTVLFAMLADPSVEAKEQVLAPVVQRLLEGFWAANDVAALLGLLGRLRGAAESAPRPENRATAGQLALAFFDAARVAASLELLQAGSLPVADAVALWEHAGDAHFEAILAAAATMPEGPVRQAVIGFLRSRLSTRPDLVRAALGSHDTAQVRAALSLLDERLEAHYTKELLALASHPAEVLRLKGVAFAGKVGGPAAFAVLWKAMESEPSRGVRLLAFRQMAVTRPAGLVDKLRALINNSAFAKRPAWERIKYARLLGTVGGAQSLPFFESLVPTKRWFWGPEDVAQAEVALQGLSSCGAAGMTRLKEIADSGGKRGEVATKVIGDLAKRDPGETLTGLAPHGELAERTR